MRSVFLRKILFVALIVGLLSSCSAQSITSDNASRGDNAGEETTGSTTATRLANSPMPSQSTPTSPAVGASGMVSSAHPLATQAGLKILADGGNAFDAAVAVGAALNVVEPYMSGVGGYGTIVIYDAEKGETRVLDSGSRTPATLDPNVFRSPALNYVQNRRSAKAAGSSGDASLTPPFDSPIKDSTSASAVPITSIKSSLCFPSTRRAYTETTEHRLGPEIVWCKRIWQALLSG